MAQAGPVHPHGLGRRDLWDQITSAVGNAFDPSDDKDSKDTKTTSTTSEKEHKTKTNTKTVLTTDAPSTYTGPLTTKTSPKATAKTTTPQTTTTSSTKKATTTSKSTKAAAKTTDTSTGLPTSIATTAAPSDTKLAVDTTHRGITQTSTTASAVSATSTPAATTGTSTGAKAGIAIGVLAGVFFVFAIVFFLFRKHRQKVEARRIADDEKVNGPFADSAAIGGVKQNPSRLSFKPVAQFLGGAGAGAAAGGAAAGASQYDSGFPSRRQSRGANIAMRDQPPMSNRGQPGSAWDRPSTGNDGNNPFGDGAQRLNSPFSPSQHGFPGMGPTSPDANGVSPVSPSGSIMGNGAAFAGGAAAGAAAGTMLTRKASTRKDGPNALDLTLAAPNSNLGAVPPSPAGTEYSMHSIASGVPVDASASGAAIAAAGGPAVSTVHRVQLDFKPTLEDELELRAGQLVRLLHEYDDGWALCIRLDRSKQGVVPRTCLSTRPVKPRPPQNGARPGPPVNPSGRPITPQGGPGGPGRMGPGPMGVPTSMMPGQGRPQSPATNRPNTPQGAGGPGMSPTQMLNNQMRPQSPYGGPPRSASPANAGARSMSPAPGAPAELSGAPAGPAGAPRPQSPGNPGMGARKVTPPGPSPMGPQGQQMRPTNSIGRKPVPGQAY